MILASESMSAAQQPSGLMAWFSSPNEWSVVFSKAGLQDIHITSCCAPVCLRRANLVKVTLCGSLSVQTQQQRPASPLGLCHDSPITTHTQYMQHRYPVFFFCCCFFLCMSVTSLTLAVLQQRKRSLPSNALQDFKHG